MEGSEQRSGSSSKGSGQISFAEVGAAFLVQWETRQVSQRFRTRLLTKKTKVPGCGKVREGSRRSLATGRIQ